jgi:DNA-directed RNA polymerase subunit RPC12/RpoP
VIIFGTRVREKVIASGQFDCPNCHGRRIYEHKRADRYFALYFIPLFKTGDLGEYVECQTCHNKYKPDVLSYREPTPAERMMATIKNELDAGLPLHMARQRLVNARVTPEEADRVVMAAAGDNPVTCPTCGFAYKHTVTTCNNCGARLMP